MDNMTTPERLAIDRIEALQPKERGPVWMVCEQLKDIICTEPGTAEIIAQDMEVPELQPDKCEKQIKAWADKHRTGNFACVTPAESDRIIREFYGLPQRGESVKRAEPAGGVALDLAALLGV